MKKDSIPKIEQLTLADLVIDNAHSGRTEAEIKTNAKALAPLFKAAGGWDASQPGEYFERDGRPHLLAGFTRVAAAQSEGFETGYFVRVEDDASKLRTAPLRTNAGKSISPYMQGKIFAEMKKGTDTATAEVGAQVFEPMSNADIAKEVGVSRQWVDQCIGVFESSPEIAELILENKVAVGAVTKARQLVKDEKKQLAFIRAAIRQAASEGKETATLKHLEAVRADYAPLKAKGSEKKDEPKADEGKSDYFAKAEGATVDGHEQLSNTFSTVEPGENDAPDLDVPEPPEDPKETDVNGREMPSELEQPELLAPQETAPQPDNKEKLLAEVAGKIREWVVRHSLAADVSDEQINELAHEISGVELPF